MFAEDIIIKPVLTEKGYDGIASKKYTFYVKKDANKTEIKLAVEKLFGGVLPECTKGYEGIAQQYIFHYARMTKLEI